MLQRFGEGIAEDRLEMAVRLLNRELKALVWRNSSRDSRGSRQNLKSLGDLCTADHTGYENKAEYLVIEMIGDSVQHA